MTRAVVRAEGEVIVAECEGGFAPDEVRIGGKNLVDLLCSLYGITADSRGSLAGNEGYRELPPVRITIELMEED